MSDISSTIGSLTPTVCRLAGFDFPKECSCLPEKSVADYAEKMLPEGELAEKILIYAPDAIGDVLLQKYPELFSGLFEKSPDILRVETSSVMPTVTPVCFATMFSGALPDVHGIKEYVKPVLTCDTLFDVFARAGKKVAIVSVNACSIDCIFRNRPIEYFSLTSTVRMIEVTKTLIKEYDYDLILSYDPDYDESLHAWGPFNEKSLNAARSGVRCFNELAELTDQYWSAYNRLMIFAPDHGGHALENGKGTHGTDLADDMEMNHFYRIRKKNRL